MPAAAVAEHDALDSLRFGTEVMQGWQCYLCRYMERATLLLILISPMWLEEM